MKIQAKPKIGFGVYTAYDAAFIFDLKRSKVNKWLDTYWSGKFAGNLSEEEKYVWRDFPSKGFNFFTLIELFTVYQLREMGISFPKIALARNSLGSFLKSQYPFATKNILSDGKRIFFQVNEESLLTLDKSDQTALKEILKGFIKKLDFDSSTDFAYRYWPLGKEASIVVDPKHAFGKPVVNGTNITTENLYSLHQGGEAKASISAMYDISEKEVEDAIRFEHRKVA